MQNRVFIARPRRPEGPFFLKLNLKSQSNSNCINCDHNFTFSTICTFHSPTILTLVCSVNSLLLCLFSSMPSTRKQKAKERRSRQLDMLSDVENVDVMLGSYSRDDKENNNSENEVNLDSGSSRPQQSSNVIGEDFRSLLNSNSRENSEIAI